jgi:mitochondrial fission protein ELM1
MTDLHVTTNDGPKAWLPVIEEIKSASKDSVFQGIFTLKMGDKPDMHIAADFIVELLELYVKVKSESSTK